METVLIRLGTMDHDEAVHENGNHKLDRMVKELTDPGMPKCVQVEINPFDRVWVDTVVDTPIRDAIKLTTACFSFFESRSPIDIYESISIAPVLKHFSFSQRVFDIINLSLEILSPGAAPYPERVEDVKTPRKVLPWKNLLALHLRKSVDAHYCRSLGERTA